MYTLGGVFVNPADSGRLGPHAFDDLFFARSGEEAFEISPPMLTSREVRFLNRRMPAAEEGGQDPSWLSTEELDSFKQIYRYYPIFAESEL
jgi:hypothetical protein